MTAEAPTAGATEALVERLFAATIDTLEIASVHIGGRLGFYRALADGGDATPGELADRTGTTERYSRPTAPGPGCLTRPMTFTRRSARSTGLSS